MTWRNQFTIHDVLISLSHDAEWNKSPNLAFFFFTVEVGLICSYETTLHQAAGVWNIFSSDKTNMKDLFCPRLELEQIWPDWLLLFLKGKSKAQLEKKKLQQRN